MTRRHLKRVTFLRPQMTDAGTRTTLHVQEGGYLYIDDTGGRSFDLSSRVPKETAIQPWVRYSTGNNHAEIFRVDLVASYSEDIGLNTLVNHFDTLEFKYRCGYHWGLDPTREDDTPDKQAKHVEAGRQRHVMRQRVAMLQRLLKPHLKPLIDPELVAELVKIEPPEEGTSVWDHLLEDD